MATDSVKPSVSADNCCNGVVGRRLVELAREDKVIREMIAPTGVEIIARATAAGMGVSSDNCCNGVVGGKTRELSNPM
jgi:hypothetical protein